MKKLWESIKGLFSKGKEKPEGKKKEKWSKKKKTMVILCIVLAIVLVLLIGGAIYMDSMLGLINRDPGQETMSSSEYHDWMNGQTESRPEGLEEVDPNNMGWTAVDPIELREGIINILLIGQDTRESGSRARSDAMILCTIDTVNSTITLTSFMRDMYVQIPGYDDNRINVSYLLGGSELLDKCIYTNFGVPIHGNVAVDFYGCMEAIDILGGVDIELTAAEAKYLNKHGNWEVTNEKKWNLQAGVNHLTGSQAVAYARIRNIGNNDYGRTERQRKVLTALLNGCKGLSVAEVDALVRKILPNLTTDMSNSDLLGHVWTVFKMLPSLQMNSSRVPADGAFREAWVRGMAVLIPDLSANRDVLAKIMGK